MKRIFLMSMVVVILGICATSAPAQKPIELSITYHYVAGSIDDQNIQRWAKKVEADSNGRLKFKIYPGGVLVGAFETYHSIPKGVADIGGGYRYGKGAPITDELFSMGLMGTPNVATSTRVVEDLMKKYPELYDKEWGETKILWIGADPAAQPVTRKPLRTPENGKGMELRAPILPMSEVCKAMGAKPTAMPMADFVIGLQRGTVDGGITTIINIRSFKLTASVKYCTEFAWVACPTWYLVMNKDKWKALPTDLQKVIDDNCVWGKRETVNMLDEETQAAKKWAMKEGMEFLTLTKEEQKKWATLIEPVYIRLAANLDAQGYPATSAFKFARERLEHYAK